MIITIFGDVHGNLIALEKLFELEKSQTDIFISHGDIVNYGPWTNECIEFLKDIPNCVFLKGNHEQYFIDGLYTGTNIIASTFFDHCYLNFDRYLLNGINKYKNKIEIENFTIQHTILNQYIFADTDITNLEIDTNYIIGHSHQQFKIDKKKFKIYNTGSLGQNRQFINQSCYLKFDTITKKFELKNFKHDINKVIDKMKFEKYPKMCIDYYLSKKQIS
jgi:predicted phosphodiesterase